MIRTHSTSTAPRAPSAPRPQWICCRGRRGRSRRRVLHGAGSFARRTPPRELSASRASRSRAVTNGDRPGGGAPSFAPKIAIVLLRAKSKTPVDPDFVAGGEEERHVSLRGLRNMSQAPNEAPLPCSLRGGRGAVRRSPIVSIGSTYVVWFAGKRVARMILDSLEQTAGPSEFDRQDPQSQGDHDQGGARRDEHHHADRHDGRPHDQHDHAPRVPNGDAALRGKKLSQGPTSGLIASGRRSFLGVGHKLSRHNRAFVAPRRQAARRRSPDFRGLALLGLTARRSRRGPIRVLCRSTNRVCQKPRGAPAIWPPPRPGSR